MSPMCSLTPSRQNSGSSHEKRGAHKKRKAPQPPTSIPVPVRDALAMKRNGEPSGVGKG